MWTPSRQFSHFVTIRHVTYDEDNTDKYNRPKPITNDVVKLGEVIPFSSAIKRQAIGITDEEAYKINLDYSTNIDSDDVVLIDGREFKVVSIADYNIIRGFPLQIIVVHTGQKEGVKNG